MRPISACLVALASLVGGAALAQMPPPAKGPLAALALEAAQVAVATCKANGYNVAAVVVDSSGMPKIVVVGDGAPGMVATFAQRKAYTANALKTPTAVVAEKIKTDAALDAQIKADPKMISWAGGMPLMAGGEVIGALGVGGAPGGDKDDVCTVAAINKIKARL